MPTSGSILEDVGQWIHNRAPDVPPTRRISRISHGSFPMPLELYWELRCGVMAVKTRLEALSGSPLSRWRSWAVDFIAGTVNRSDAGTAAVRAHIDRHALAHDDPARDIAEAADLMAQAVFAGLGEDDRSARRLAKRVGYLVGTPVWS